MTFLRPLTAILLFALLATHARAATLPGFRIETLARSDGFVSSVAVDSHGIIYFTTTDGWIRRVDGSGAAARVASLPTHAGGNGGLLGMALLDDDTAVVHYTVWNDESGELAKVLDDVISRVDLRTGSETVLHVFVCDVDHRPNGASSEHHGGNPAVAPDGSVFVGIGEYGGHILAQLPHWNGGKIWRVFPDGTATQWALGLRNPYDLAFDPDTNRVVVADNGSQGGDEIHVLQQGDNAGWPMTYGNQPPVEGTVAPVYVWPETVAPTGLTRLTGANGMLRRGYLAGAFVTRAIYYLPPSFAQAIPLVEELDDFVIDVTQSANGEILFATASWSGTAIHRLSAPPRGDCNGDGRTDQLDIFPLMLEIQDGGSHPMITAQGGAYAGSWGCDANADGMIDAKDLKTLTDMIKGRRRAVGHR